MEPTDETPPELTINVTELIVGKAALVPEEDALSVPFALVDASARPSTETTEVPSLSPPTLHGLQSLDIEFLPEETLPVGQLLDGTQQQYAASGLYAYGKYRIHVGTRPGSEQARANRPINIPYEESLKRHRQIITLLTQFRPDLRQLRMKELEFDIFLDDGVSNSGTFGVEPYAAIIFKLCERVKVEAVAGIIGRIFRQDGIGIFDENADWGAHPIGETADEDYYVHRFYTISRSSVSDKRSISNDEARTMMMAIRHNHNYLSGQFGQSRAMIELHDFDNKSNAATIHDLQQIVNVIFNNQNYSYQIEERRAKSRLLWHTEYDRAIQQAQYDALALLIESVRIYDGTYPL